MGLLRNILIVLNIVSLYFVYENWQEKKKGVIIKYKTVNNQQVISECYIKPRSLRSQNDLSILFNKIEKETFVNYPTVYLIPNYIFAFLKCITKSDFSIANPEESWNAGCSKMEGLADRRLINFKMGKKTAILTYETGGIGVMRHIVVFEFNQKQVINIWSPFVERVPNLENENVTDYFKTIPEEYWYFNYFP